MADEMDEASVPEDAVPEDRVREGGASDDSTSTPGNELAQAAQATDHEDEGAAAVSAAPQAPGQQVPDQQDPNRQEPDRQAPDLSAASAAELAPAAAGSVDAVQSSAASYAETFRGPAAHEDGPPASPRATAAKPAPAASSSSHAAVNDLAMPGLDLLYDVELDATLQFGSKEMLLRDVLELGPGDVVELDRHIAEPVDLVVGDRIVARGEVVVASGNFALRVTEVATPQMRLESIRCLF